MVFSSNPAYHDASNWQLQQQNHHQIIGGSSVNSLLPPLQPEPSQSLQTPPPQLHGGGGSIRPGSMSERARMANINGPEIALECPRCKSINTKFCYYNNYSLTQPRHFCKTCRRYWTKGGALRSVPVGGGCRRNKRSKSTTSKSSPASTERIVNSTNNNISCSNGSTSILGLTTPQFPPTRFLSPLVSQLINHHNFTSEMNYSNISAPMVGSSDMNFSNLFGSGGVASFLSSSGGGGGVSEAWRPPQFPFSDVNHIDSSPMGNYPFNSGESGFEGVFRPPSKISSSMLSQMASSVKMEDHNKEKSDQVNLSRQILQMQGNDNLQWNNNISSNSSSAWTELSNFGSSSTNNL